MILCWSFLCLYLLLGLCHNLLNSVYTVSFEFPKYVVSKGDKIRGGEKCVSPLNPLAVTSGGGKGLR